MTLYFVGDNTSTAWHHDPNWHNAPVGSYPGNASTPTGSDAVIFDGSGTGNCILTANAACASITAANGGGYTGTFNAAGFNIDIDGNCELQDGTWTLGSGTWFVEGGMQHAYCTNWIGDGATIDFNGSGSFSWTQINDAADRAATIIIRAGVTLTPASRIYANNYDVYGTIPLSFSGRFMTSYAGYIKVYAGGEISGAGYITLMDTPNNQGFLLNEGTVSVAYILIRGPDASVGESAYLAPGTYDTEIRLNTYSGTSAAARYQLTTMAGTINITGDLWIESGSGRRNLEFENAAGCILNIGGDLRIDEIASDAASVVEFDNSANNETMTISGDMLMTTLGTGTITFAKSGAGGDIDFNGSAAQEIDALGQDIGKISISKGTSGDVVITDADLNLYSCTLANNFVQTAGDITVDTNSPAFQGDVTLNGGTFVNSGVSILFDGTSTFVDNVGQNIGDVYVGPASTLVLATVMECDDFLGGESANISGAFLITVNGNFALNGTNGNEITFNGPDLDITGTAEAHFTTATDSDASAGTEVDATDNCTDGTGNTNWNFGGIEAHKYYYVQQEAVA